MQTGRDYRAATPREMCGDMPWNERAAMKFDVFLNIQTIIIVPHFPGGHTGNAIYNPALVQLHWKKTIVFGGMTFGFRVDVYPFAGDEGLQVDWQLQEVLGGTAQSFTQQRWVLGDQNFGLGMQTSLMTTLGSSFTSPFTAPVTYDLFPVRYHDEP
jgi:hypothetical protein